MKLTKEQGKEILLHLYEVDKVLFPENDEHQINEIMELLNISDINEFDGIDINDCDDEFNSDELIDALDIVKEQYRRLWLTVHQISGYDGDLRVEVSNIR